MRMRVLIGVLSAVFLFVPRLGTAQPVFDAHRCDNCSSMQQMSGVAVQHGLGTRYVYSVSNAEIRKFEVERWCGDNPQGSSPVRGDGGRSGDPSCSWWQYIAVEKPIEHQVTAFVHDMRSAYFAYGNSFHGYEEISYNQLAPYLNEQGPNFVGRTSEPNAYDFVESGSLRNEVLGVYNTILDQMNNPHTIFSLMRGSISFAAHGVGINFNMQGQSSLRSRLQFNDGSHVMVRIESNPDRAVYVPGSAVDANNTLIPDYTHVPGGANHPGGLLGGPHNPSDPERWMNWVAQLGIPITPGTSFSCGMACGGGTCQLSCLPR